MKCSFCDLGFDQSQAASACGSCPLMKGCHLVRCPRCGYEMPPEAKLVVWLRELSRRSGSVSKKEQWDADFVDLHGNKM